MVRVVFTSGAMAATAAFLLATISVPTADAGPLELNPVTPEVVVLGHRHPAFGGELPPDAKALKPLIPTQQRRRRRWLGADDEEREAVSSKDMERITTHFGQPLETNCEKLTKYGKAAAEQTPWPSSYWPIYEDGINYMWSAQETLSPAAKYATAYGLNVKDFTDAVSKTNGVASMTARQRCQTEADCSQLTDLSGCGKRAGEATGYCIPKWFGICHAWAPAAIEEREPKCPVTKNGTTFQPLDIKALITQAYDGSHLATVFTGVRFNGPDMPENLDKDGRYNDPSRRDLGPGFFHIAIHNIMGIRKKAFILDVSSKAEVWNQPVRSYEIIAQQNMEPAAAAKEFWNLDKYIFNPEAVKISFVQLKMSWILEGIEDGGLVADGRVEKYTHSAAYEYVLELDGQGNIIGGEWVRDSRKNHPDFLWFPQGKPAMDVVTDIGLKYKDVRELLDASADCKAIDPPVTPTPTPSPSDNSTTPLPTTPSPSNSTTPLPTTPSPSNSTTPVPSSSVPGSSSPSPSTPTPTGSIKPSKSPRPGQNDDDDDDSDSGSDSTPPPGGKPTPAPGGKPTPAPGGKPTHKPTPAPGGKPTPAPGGKPTPAPGGKPTPAPGGKDTPAPTPSQTVQPTPVPTRDSNKPVPGPAPSPSGDNGKPGNPDAGKPTPAPGGEPTPAPGGKPTPAPAGEPTPAPGGKPTPVPSSDSGKPVPGPVPSPSSDNGKPGKPDSGKPGKPDSGKPTSVPSSDDYEPGKLTPAPTTAKPGGDSAGGEATPSPSKKRQCHTKQ